MKFFLLFVMWWTIAAVIAGPFVGIWLRRNRRAAHNRNFDVPRYAQGGYVPRDGGSRPDLPTTDSGVRGLPRRGEIDVPKIWARWNGVFVCCEHDADCERRGVPCRFHPDHCPNCGGNTRFGPCCGQC